MTTTASSYRFTSDDEANVLAALDSFAARRPFGRDLDTSDVPAMVAAAALGIGCHVADLRDVEVEWLTALATAIVTECPLPDPPRPTCPVCGAYLYGCVEGCTARPPFGRPALVERVRSAMAARGAARYSL